MRVPLPGAVAPMLAVPGAMPTDSEGWSFEVKWDGMRAIVHCPGDATLSVRSRSLRDMTPLWPELAGLPAALGGSGAVLDGEIIAPDEAGRPSFEALQPRMQAVARTARDAAARRPAVYVVFDVLWLDGDDLCALPYRSRRERLDSLALDGAAWRAPKSLSPVDTTALEAAVRGLGLEGVVAKRSESPYRPGLRSRDWRKVKFLLSQEFVVGGWIAGRGGRSSGIGSLALGVHDHHDGTLRYCGRVGTGFTDIEIARLTVLLDGLACDASPFSGDVARLDGVHFVRPELVVEVAFSEWTSAGVLRHPSYRGRRIDKDPSGVVRET